MIEDAIKKGGVLVSVKTKTEEARIALKNQWAPDHIITYSM